MKLNKKQLGLIIGLVCLVICLVLMLTMCGKPAGGEADETIPSESVTEATGESTAPTGESTQTTEESTEPTEESTEPTEESTQPTKVVNTNNALGSPGSTGTGSGDEDDETKPTEPEEVIEPGIEINPYTEVVAEYPGTVTTVKVPAGKTIYYNVYNTDGATLTVEDGDAYVVYNGKTFEARSGVVTGPLNAADASAPATFQIGNRSGGEEAYALKLTAPVGAPCNPEQITAIDTITANLEKGNDNGYTYSWTAQEDGTLTFVADVQTEGVTGEVILTAGETSVSLSKDGVTEKITANAVTAEIRKVSVETARDEAVTIQVIAAADAQGNQYPAAQVTLTGSFKAGSVLAESSLTVGSNAVSSADITVASVFRFKPTAAGTYTFTTSSPAAVLSYWGSDEAAMTDLTETTDYSAETNSFTITVDAASVGTTYLIGVTGAANCTLTVKTA